MKKFNVTIELGGQLNDFVYEVEDSSKAVEAAWRQFGVSVMITNVYEVTDSE